MAVPTELGDQQWRSVLAGRDHAGEAGKAGDRGVHQVGARDRRAQRQQQVVEQLQGIGHVIERGLLSLAIVCDLLAECAPGGS